MRALIERDLDDELRLNIFPGGERILSLRASAGTDTPVTLADAKFGEERWICVSARISVLERAIQIVEDTRSKE